jgi:hypothetical protein
MPNLPPLTHSFFCSSIRRAVCPTSRSLHELSDGA